MNWIWGVVLAVLVLIGTYAANQTDAARQSERTGYSNAVVGNMMVYRNHVAAYAQAHPTATGTIADADLALPAWFNRVSEVRNYVSGGQGYVYYQASSMDGQAYAMLEQSRGDLLVGINRAGRLFNPSAGLTTIVLPAAIPDGAVVFAPAALNTAVAPPPPGSPVDCAISSGTVRTWIQSGNTCSSRLASAITVAHNTTRTFSDNQTGNTGTADFLCSNGTLSATPEPGATCAPPPPANCNVAAGTTRSWSVSGATCSGPHSGATVAHGSSLTFTSTNGNDGAAGFVCSNGMLSTTPDGSETCTVPPAPCALPTPSAQTNTESQTATQTLGCAAGYSGQITQSQPQQRSQTRSAYCPAPTGAYSWLPWSTWSAWTATGPWTTSSNTCVQNCVVPPPETRTQACNAWESGSITEQRTATCPGPTGSAVWGPWVQTSNTCRPTALMAASCVTHVAKLGESAGVIDEFQMVRANPDGKAIITHTFSPRGTDRWRCSCAAGTTSIAYADKQVSRHLHARTEVCSGTPTTPANWMTIPAGVTRSWTSATASCSATLASAVTIVQGSVVVFKDTTPPGVGQGVFQLFTTSPATLPRNVESGSAQGASAIGFSDGDWDDFETWCRP